MLSLSCAGAGGGWWRGGYRLLTTITIKQNVMTMSDFIESDSALSQMLRSVAPPGVLGVGGAPVVRIVRGAGADGRWTEVGEEY